MKNEKYKYELLSDELKKNLLEKLTARYFFERRTDHGRKALIFLLSCEPKKKSRWKNLSYCYGAAIKEHREKLGMDNAKK